MYAKLWKIGALTPVRLESAFFICKTSRCVQSVWKLMPLLTFTDSSSRWE